MVTFIFSRVDEEPSATSDIDEVATAAALPSPSLELLDWADETLVWDSPVVPAVSWLLPSTPTSALSIAAAKEYSDNKTR